MKKFLFLPLLLIAVAVNGEPIVRVVSTSGSGSAFATDNVRKLVLLPTTVDVVSIEGVPLLSMPLADIARVEFIDDELPPESVEQVKNENVQCTKIFSDGQLFILHNGTMYNMQGQKVEIIKH